MTRLLESLQETSAGPAQGEQDSEDRANDRQEHPTGSLATSRSYRMNIKQGLEQSVSPHRWGKATFPRTRGDRREPGRFSHSDWKYGCEDPFARTEGAGVEGMSDLTCFYFLLCLTLLPPIYKCSSSDYNEMYHFPTWVSKFFVGVHGLSRFTLGSATGHQPL